MFVVKECSKCKEYKLLGEFHKDSRLIFGKTSVCSICKNEYQRSKKVKLSNEYQLEYRKNNKSKFIVYRKRTYIKNKAKENERSKNITNKRRTQDSLFKLRMNLSSLIRASIKRSGYKKNSRTHEILGCDYEVFKLYIEKQFKKGMNWDNYGEWHLDHIYPVSLAKDEQHLIELNHYTNFQPLWAKDNLSKSNKIIEPIQMKLKI